MTACLWNKYLIVIEKAQNNYSAFSLDLPGCITVGNTGEKTLNNIKEAIELYLEASAEHNYDVAQPKKLSDCCSMVDEKIITEEYFIAQVEIHFPKCSVGAKCR